MAKRVPLGEGWDFLTDLKWQAKLFAYDAQYGVSDGYLTVKEAEKADKEFHEIMDKWIPKVEAEICLAEIEMDNAPDIKEYESILNGNAFRTAKKASRRKANIRHHKSDRKHGKTVPQSDKKYWDEQSGTFYRWDEKRKTFSSPKKPKVHRRRKTKFDRLEVAMQDREKDLLPSVPANILDEYFLIDFELYNLVYAIEEEEAKINWKNLVDWNGFPTVECRYAGWYGVRYPSTELKHMYSRQYELQTRKDEILSMYGDVIFEDF